MQGTHICRRKWCWLLILSVPGPLPAVAADGSGTWALFTLAAEAAEPVPTRRNQAPADAGRKTRGESAGVTQRRTYATGPDPAAYFIFCQPPGCPMPTPKSPVREPHPKRRAAQNPGSAAVKPAAPTVQETAPPSSTRSEPPPGARSEPQTAALSIAAPEPRYAPGSLPHAARTIMRPPRAGPSRAYFPRANSLRAGSDVPGDGPYRLQPATCSARQRADRAEQTRWTMRCSVTAGRGFRFSSRCNAGRRQPRALQKTVSLAEVNEPSTHLPADATLSAPQR